MAQHIEETLLLAEDRAAMKPALRQRGEMVTALLLDLVVIVADAALIVLGPEFDFVVLHPNARREFGDASALLRRERPPHLIDAARLTPVAFRLHQKSFRNMLLISEAGVWLLGRVARCDL